LVDPLPYCAEQAEGRNSCEFNRYIIAIITIIITIIIIITAVSTRLQRRESLYVGADVSGMESARSHYTEMSVTKYKSAQCRRSQE
jgi:hypothetical protein